MTWHDMQNVKYVNFVSDYNDIINKELPINSFDYLNADNVRTERQWYEHAMSMLRWENREY